MASTSTIQQFKRVEDSLRKLAKAYDSVLKQELTCLLREVLSEVRKRSPVDTSTFQRRWKFTIESGKGLSIGTVSNDLDYGRFLELGSEKGKPPWPKPGKRTTYGPGGRIFSTQAVGGIIGPMFEDLWFEKAVERFGRKFVERWLNAFA